MRAVRARTQDDHVDTLGARHLAARLRARVRVGTMIVLEADDHESGLVAGDRGIVDEITPEGVTVDWEKGFRLSIDPDRLPYRAFEAA
jgi:hypothetical protein